MFKAAKGTQDDEEEESDITKEKESGMSKKRKRVADSKRAREWNVIRRWSEGQFALDVFKGPRSDETTMTIMEQVS